jgi:hypothetical protein
MGGRTSQYVPLQSAVEKAVVCVFLFRLPTVDRRCVYAIGVCFDCTLQLCLCADRAWGSVEPVAQ